MVTESLSERCFSSPWPPPPAPRPGFILPEELHARVSRGSVQAERAGAAGSGGPSPPSGTAGDPSEPAAAAGDPSAPGASAPGTAPGITAREETA